MGLKLLLKKCELSCKKILKGLKCYFIAQATSTTFIRIKYFLFLITAFSKKCSVLFRDFSPCDSRIDSVLLLQQIDGDRQRGRGRGRAERRREGVRHVGDELERELPRAHGVDHGQDDESVDKEAEEDRHEVVTELAGDEAHVLHAEDLRADEEEDADGGHVDDPGGDDHHGLRQAGEELQQRLPAFLHHGQRNTKNH